MVPKLESSLTIYADMCRTPVKLDLRMSHLHFQETLLNCRRFTEMNCLGYVISALSSRDSAMRGAAYAILAAFYHQLEGARFPEKYQVRALILINFEMYRLRIHLCLLMGSTT